MGGRIRGRMEYENFEAGKPLSRKQAMLAMCYECNGSEESRIDCKGYGCPMYQYHPHRGKKYKQEKSDG